MKKILLMIAGVILSAPFFVSAQTAQLTDQFAGDQTTCVELQYNMSYRSRDAKTNGEVSDLQDFLISQGYLFGEPTGYFGTATLAAVKRFQSAVGLGSAGSPGYGGVGPKTRAKIKAMTCGGSTTTTATPATSSLPVIPQATTQATTVTPTATQASTPTISITSPQPGASYSIGSAIPIRWVFANVPQRTQAVVDIRLVAQTSNASGSVAGGTWQSSEYTTRTSGNDSYDKTTGAGYLDVSGTYEIVAKIVSCDPRGCAYANSSSNTVWATSNPLRVYIGIPASQSVTPYAATFSATNITATSATLPGYTEPNSISRRFEWGTSSTGMYNTTPFRNNGTTSDFSETISGLTPSTTYYFRTVAHTAQGADVIGNTLSFTTEAVLVAAPTVTLSVSPTTVAMGDSTTITWSSTNATSCSRNWLNGGTIGVSGTDTQSVYKTIEGFTVTCTGPGGSATKYVAISVTTPTLTCVAPHITSPSPLPGYSIALTAGQVGGGQLFTADQPVTYSIPPNVPMWVSLSGNKVDFATMGTPGTYNFTIVATNSCGAKDTQTIPVIVSAAPVVSTSPTPTVEFLGVPTLSLQYDSVGKEANLVGSATVKITTGNTSVNTIYVPYVLRFWQQGVARISSNSMLSSVSSANSLAVIPANTSATFTLAYSVPAKELFAGAYYLGLADFTYLDANGTSQTLPFTSFKNAWGSNAVTIIGETSPYIGSINALQDSVTISGVRFATTGNTVSVGGNLFTIGSINNGTTISFLPADYGITAGSYPVQVTSPTTGASNIVYINIVAPTPPLVPVTSIKTYGDYYNSLTEQEKIQVTPYFLDPYRLNPTIPMTLGDVIMMDANRGITRSLVIPFSTIKTYGDYYYSLNLAQRAQLQIEVNRLQVVVTNSQTAITQAQAKQLDLNWGIVRPAGTVMLPLSGQPQLASVIGAFTQAPVRTPSPAWAYNWTRNLEVNSPYTDDVSALQTALAKEGVFSGEVTGGFYTQTYLAVKAFQAKYGIESTGFVGPITLAKLNALY